MPKFLKNSNRDPSIKGMSLEDVLLANAANIKCLYGIDLKGEASCQPTVADERVS